MSVRQAKHSKQLFPENLLVIQVVAKSFKQPIIKFTYFKNHLYETYFVYTIYQNLIGIYQKGPIW